MIEKTKPIQDCEDRDIQEFTDIEILNDDELVFHISLGPIVVSFANIEPLNLEF